MISTPSAARRASSVRAWSGSATRNPKWKNAGVCPAFSWTSRARSKPSLFADDDDTVLGPSGRGGVEPEVCLVEAACSLLVSNRQREMLQLHGASMGPRASCLKICLVMYA